jgi:glycolate oxidase iron-sulfur subunit
VSELLTELGPVAGRHPAAGHGRLPRRLHLGHAQGVRAQPRELLRGIPGLELREVADADICCGSAGSTTCCSREPAGELGDRKAASVLRHRRAPAGDREPGLPAAGAAAIGAPGGRIALAHTVEVLDASPARTEPSTS